MTRFVIFGCTADANYSFPAPLTIALWRQHGYEPIMVRVGEWRSREAELSERACIALGARVVPFDLAGCIWSGEWISKCVRFMAPTLPFVEADDFVTTTDADLLPLDVEYMKEPDPEKFNVFNASAYVGFRDHLYPMVWLAAKSKVWRELVRPSCGDLRKATIEFVEKWNAIGREQNGNVSDEMILRALLMGWPHWPQGANLVSRPTKRCMVMADRIDRDLAHVENAKDVHLPRPSWTPDVWPRIRDIAYPKLTHDQRRQIDTYHAAWTNTEIAKEWGS